MRIVSIGHGVLAVTLIAFGIVGLTQRELLPIWMPATLPAHEALGCLCAVISLACGAGLLWARGAATAARVLLVYLVPRFVVFKLRYVLPAPTAEVSYERCGETAVIVAGALVDHTALLVPAWLPWHVGWAYLTGSAYLLAGAAVLTGICARAAASLSALQMGLFTLLVWAPIVAAGRASVPQIGASLSSPRNSPPPPGWWLTHTEAFPGSPGSRAQPAARSAATPRAGQISCVR